MNNQKTTNHEKISRIEALKKIGNYGKYSALTAIGTYMLLNPKKAQAFSFIMILMHTQMMMAKTIMKINSN